MSNYINVLRRLERERQAPEHTPLAPTPAATTPSAMSVASPIVAPVEGAVTPPVTEPVAPVALAPAPIERTVIALPTAPPPAPAPTPIAVAPVMAPTTARPAAPTPTAMPAPLARSEHVSDTRRSRAFAAPAHPGLATLLDAIRLISNARPTRVVVFCGASNAESVTTLAEGLVAHASRNGMPALLATLTRTATGSALVPAHGSSMDAVLPIDLNGTPSVETLARWTQQVGPGADLVVITGPPLAKSIDAALLACAADGLVIVAESEVTERAALQVAAERARIAGCNTLGVVMHGTKNHMPKWLSRLMGDRSESQSS